MVVGQPGGPPGDPVVTEVILRGGISAEVDNKISSIISEYLPGFVNDNHPGFVGFIEAYYEWMEKVENPYGTSITLMDKLDVDRTVDSFVEYFKETYLYNFPKTFATSTDGNYTSNVKTILKNINDFYRAKGTEKAYKFLLRILHDSDCELFYPRVDILKLSDGKWIENKSIKITTKNDDTNFLMKNQIIKQYHGNQINDITAYATVESVYQYNIRQYAVTELFLRDISGTFIQGANVKCTLSDDSTISEVIYSVPSEITILDGGSGYRSSDIVEIDESSSEFVSGAGAKGTVTKVSETGVIKSARIDNFGVNYKTTNFEETLPLVFRSASGNAGASGNVNLNALCNYPGYWANNDGKLSSNKKVRDNDYYQEYSYLLKAEVSLDKYKSQVKNLIHPAGTKMFGDISIINAVSTDSLGYNETVFHITKPIIGRYVPYTLDTSDNLIGTTASGSLVDLYPTGFNPGATSANHCLGNTGGRISIVAGSSTGGYTLGSFIVGEEILGSSSGATSDVFGWHRNTATGGVVFNEQNSTGGIIRFQADEMVTSDAGMTGIIRSVNVGNGTVLESGSYTHTIGPDGGLTDGATAYGLTAYWDIQTSVQSLSEDIDITVDVNVFHTTTTGYTCGFAGDFDYTIGNEVKQGTSDYGSQPRGVVMEWIPGISGSVANTLKIKKTRGDDFVTGTAIIEINNRNPNTDFPTTYIFGGSSADEIIRNKIKHLKLEESIEFLKVSEYNSDV